MSAQLHTLLQNTEPWSLSLSVVGPVLGALALASLLFSTTRKSLPNEPPMVPYLLPWIGHSLSMIMDAKRFFAEANLKYGEMYSIVYFGRKIVVVNDKSIITELFKAGEEALSFGAAGAEIVPFMRVLDLSYGHKDLPHIEDGSMVQAIRENMKLHQIGALQSHIEEGTKTAIDKDIGPNGVKWDNPWDTLQGVIARISSLCFAGEEIGRDEAVVTTMAEITKKLIFAGLASSYSPTWLGDILVKYVFSLTAALDVLHDRAKPILDQRRLKKEQQPDWEPPQDMLQFMLDMPLSNGQDRPTSDPAVNLAVLGLASIHTSSMTTLFALHELAAQPEVAASLRAEITKAASGAGGAITPELTDRLPGLDSLVRETLRFNSDILGMRHLAVRDYAFRNGMTVEKGTLVAVSTHAVHCDPQIQPAGTNENLDKFDAFRFANFPSKKAYNASPSYIAFGEGPHTCPGRFFAIQEVKYLLASILVQYDIKTTLKGRAPNRYIMGMTTFPPSHPLIFEPIEKKQDK